MHQKIVAASSCRKIGRTRALGVVMGIATVRCDVLGANVTRITDLEGAVTRIICSEYQESTGACRLMIREHPRV
jgi:hypothetical protein